MPFLDIPPQMQERVVCSVSAAVKYDIPANIVLAVAEKEAGKPGRWVKNSNGTHDVGTMQFNTGYLHELARHGITANDVAAAGCYPFDLAAWRLRQHIRNDSGDLWTRAANYHSRTPQYNATYRADLMRKAAKWADWLDARFVTADVKKWTAISSMPNAISRATPAATARPTPSTMVPPGRHASYQEEKYVPRQLITSDR